MIGGLNEPTDRELAGPKCETCGSKFECLCGVDLTTAERWDNMHHEECAEICHRAKVAPWIANEPWNRIASEVREMLLKEMKP